MCRCCPGKRECARWGSKAESRDRSTLIRSPISREPAFRVPARGVGTTHALPICAHFFLLARASEEYTPIARARRTGRPGCALGNSYAGQGPLRQHHSSALRLAAFGVKSYTLTSTLWMRFFPEGLSKPARTRLPSQRSSLTPWPSPDWLITLIR